MLQEEPGGVFEQCYMDPYSASLYPDGCLLASRAARRAACWWCRAPRSTQRGRLVPSEEDAPMMLMEGGSKFGRSVLPPLPPITTHHPLPSFCPS